jgi:class 3 adenylate cyclase
VVAAKLRLSEGQAAPGPGPAASQGKDLEALQSLVAEHTRALYHQPESTWHKTVQWVKGKDMPGPTANESIVTVEPQAFDRIASGTLKKGFLADMLSRKQPRAPDGTLERLSAAEVRALLTGDEPEMKAHAQQLLAKARWVIILLGHRPRTPSGMEEAGGIDTVKWSLQLVRKLPVLRPGAQKPRVAVIACQVPYYLEESDIAAVDVYLITHTKLERHVELAVDALLGAGDAGGLLSPVSIPGARYDLAENAPAIPGALASSTQEQTGERADRTTEPAPRRQPYWLIAVAALVVAGIALICVWRWHRLRTADYARLPEVLYTFLAVDVRGSTGLKAGHDPVSVRRTFDAYHEWIRETVRGHQGEVYSTSGDGVLCRFARAGEALDAARELRASLDTFNSEANQLSEPLLIGMGLHTGPLLETPGEEHGTVSSTTLDLAMKLEAQAEPREILLSGETVVRLPSREGIQEAGRVHGEVAVYRAQ